MRLVLRASGPAPAATAWERYADVSLWRTWSPQISAVHVRGPMRLRTGLHGTVLGLPLLGRPLLVARFVVEGFDEQVRRWSWRVEPARAVVPVPAALGCWARMRLVHAVTGEDLGSATSLQVTGAAPLVLAYAVPAWVALRQLVR